MMSAEAIREAVVEDPVRLALARRGDAATLEQLYVDHIDALLRHARALLHDVREAQDLAHDAFAVAFRTLPRFRGDATFGTYLHGIALNLARRRWRHSARTRAAMSALRWFSGRPTRNEPRLSEGIDAGREVQALADAVETLRPAQREAFVLLLVEQLPGDEAARVAGVRPEVLRVRATRAKQAVRAAMRRRLGEET